MLRTRSRARSRTRAEEGAIFTTLETATRLALNNGVSDELYRCRPDGPKLGVLQAKLHSSKGHIMESIDDAQNALIETSAALYFSALSYDVNSVQTALCVLKCAEAG